MKQYDDFDKKLEAVMKKNLQDTHASQDLINRTLLRLGEAKTQAVVTPVKKKKRVIPVALISGIAAILLALVGVTFVFLRLSKVTSKSDKDVRKAGDTAKISVAEAKDESIEIDGGSRDKDLKIENNSNTLTYGSNEESEEDSIECVSIASDSVTSGNYYSGGNYAVGEYFTKDRSSMYYFGSFNFSSVTSPFDELNNFYFSIEDRTYTSSDDFRINNKDDDDINNNKHPGRLANH